MISSFADAETARIWNGDRSRRLPQDIQRPALRKLRQLNRIVSPYDRLIPPGNRFEELKGDREGTYSIRINAQWRVTFRWEDGAPVMSASKIIIDDSERLPNIHPGEILREDFLIGNDISAAEVAAGSGIAPDKLEALLNERVPIDAESALRLARYFGMSETFFLGLQNDFDLEEARSVYRADLDHIVPRAA
ncbi:HigA family addiction module antitoxin [Sphingomonas sp. RIT328]|uniref:HigA family addiction module antitoxin n=1 Tax=Sphingomonas sp. RIT328 TaxID=1470591 RepID=UPI00044F7F4C|nr:Plasmid maintenance system antidote protein, XRE family [Sphingomonas sp. RIT328]